MLKLISGNNAQLTISPIARDLEAEGHHRELIENFLRSHRIKNHAPETIATQGRLLTGWFSQYGIGERPLYVWEAMEPVKGRQRVLEYATTLIESGIRSKTVRSYLGVLHHFFSFVLEHPYIKVGEDFKRIQDLYGHIEKPVSEFDMPTHSYDGEQLGVPLDPEKLYDFYDALRRLYLADSAPVKARNYTLAVLAGETGLRIDELIHLETKDLFFESHKLQTRFAKGTDGSGKRARVTLFPPLARDTIRFYLKEHRPCFPGHQKADYLFLSHTGKILTYSTLHASLTEMIQIVKEADFPVFSHLSWHWFRRLFATRFIERFPDKLYVLIDLLGHSGPGTVHRYIRHSKAWIDNEIQGVLERIDKWPFVGD